MTLDIEKPTAGGRMLARHGGQIVLVDGAIPGERVVAEAERTGKGVVFARTVQVLRPSPDRRASGDRRCGGTLFAHIEYPRQLSLKSDIIQDAFVRIARHRLGTPPPVAGSPEEGYRMRARLHARGPRLGFFREGTHELCDAANTRQLLQATHAWIAGAERTLAAARATGLVSVDLAENLPGDERVCHLELAPGADPEPFTALAAGLQGLTAHVQDAGPVHLAGSPTISDVLHGREGDPSTALRLRRHVRSFFQSNRFLVEPLVRHVLRRVPDGPVIDLYAGVGLFGLSLAAAGHEDVTLVEGDERSGRDLARNAEPLGDRAAVEPTSVERFLASLNTPLHDATVIVDPPRTGVSRHALGSLVRIRPRRIVYVSCDVPTLARDARSLLTSGYDISDLSGIDLFPNTAHVETVCVFDDTSR